MSLFKQIFKVIENLGFKEEAKKSFHLKYNFVELKTGPMRSRDGNIVPIKALINQMRAYVKNHFLNKYENEWSENKINKTADDIAQGAIKYGMNEQDLSKKIVFDKDKWLSLEGRSGPYIQYAHARACSLLKKQGVWQKPALAPLGKAFNNSINMEHLSAPEEWRLILHLSWFSLTIETSAWQMKTSPLCYYLFELAQQFSRFYQNCPIGSLKNKEQKEFRLFLTQVTQNVLREGLLCLSIPAPESM